MGAQAERGITVIGDQKGASLVEVLIALAILGIAIVAFLGAISTESIGVGTVDERVTVENLVRSQMEYTKSQEYLTAPVSYDTVAPPSADFTITAEATTIPGADDNIQKITVTVSRNGEVLVVKEDFKVNR